jgi:hypothetical protein
MRAIMQGLTDAGFERSTARKSCILARADTKLPLTSWYRAMHLLSSTKQCISAVELGRRLGVSYPTAWYLHKRLVTR